MLSPRGKLQRYLELNFDLFVRHRIPTIVYSMGRSGSTGLFNSLQARGEFVIFAHSLRPEILRQYLLPSAPKWASRHIIAPGRTARIISLVRNPVECMVSAFGSKLSARCDPVHGYAGVSVEDLSRQFTTRYFDRQRHLEKLHWFDTEFRPTLGIDVYQHPFDKEAGYSRFRAGPYDVLILRTGLPDARKAALVSDFLGVAGLQIGRARVREQQPIGELYRIFKEGVTIPVGYLVDIVNSKYARHFFTQDELDRTRQRYAGPRMSDAAAVSR